MSFVSDFQFDVFVSYAHVDNQPAGDAKRGWVSSLIGEFQRLLAEQVGRNTVSVFFDTDSIRGDRALTAEISERVDQSAIFLCVLSTGYVSADWCRLELETFMQNRQRLRLPGSRLFVVEKNEVAPDACPAHLRDQLRLRFWAADGGRHRTLSIVEPRYRPDDFNGLVNKLSVDVAQALHELKEARQASPAERVRVSEDPRADLVKPLPDELRRPAHSSALFVGVGRFDSRSYLAELKYAVDDAVLLAWEFVKRLRLIDPAKATLALGSEPTTETAKARLIELKESGIRCINAARTELLFALDEMAENVNSEDGLALMTFSTHGCTNGGSAYLMPVDGARRFIAETGIPLQMIYDAFHQAATRRRLLVIDACRESLDGVVRGGPATTAEFQNVLKQAGRLSLLSSCGEGQASWESPRLEQGIFTHFLLQGIRGEAPARQDDAQIRLGDVFAFALAGTDRFARKDINAEQIPWYGGDPAMCELPLAISTKAEQQLESRRKRSDAMAATLANLAAAREEHPDEISAECQRQVELELNLLEGDEFDEMIQSLTVLKDRSRTSCRMFSAWWNQRHVPTAKTNLSQPSMGGSWQNTLGMRFLPLAKVLFGVWQTRVSDFREFVRNTGYDATSGDFYSLSGGEWKPQPHSWLSHGFDQGPLHPVVGVAWADAAAFCDWLTERELASGVLSGQQHYRLPSDVEWSEAVGINRYPWGSEWPPPSESGNYGVEPSVTSGQPMMGTQDVGSFAPSARGIYDLGGNVWEWCDGFYRSDMNDPEVRSEREFLDEDGGGQSYRFLRGGSWFNKLPLDLRSDYRNPGKYPDARFANVGFRCVLDLGDSAATFNA